MKEKTALFIACLIIGFGFGAILYFMDLVKNTKDFFSYSLTFGISMFLFELFVRPAIDKAFKKDK